MIGEMYFKYTKVVLKYYQIVYTSVESLFCLRLSVKVLLSILHIFFLDLCLYKLVCVYIYIQIAVSMGNGKPGIKDAAQFITEDNTRKMIFTFNKLLCELNLFDIQ